MLGKFEQPKWDGERDYDQNFVNLLGTKKIMKRENAYLMFTQMKLFVGLKGPTPTRPLYVCVCTHLGVRANPTLGLIGAIPSLYRWCRIIQRLFSLTICVTVSLSLSVNTLCMLYSWHYIGYLCLLFLKQDLCLLLCKHIPIDPTHNQGQQVVSERSWGQATSVQEEETFFEGKDQHDQYLDKNNGFNIRQRMGN